MNRFRITVEYDGRPFVGWQRQDNRLSVQGAIEAAIHSISGETVAVYGAGRTDAGVHAAGMTAHFDLARDIAPARLLGAINALVRPHPVAVLDCAAAPGFHARFDCIGRRYRYAIVNRRAPLTWQRGLAWRVPEQLDADAMHIAAQRLVGQHDFTTFRSAHCQARSPIRSLERLDVRREGEMVLIEADARSFLQHQVRSMVGCLKLVGQGRWSADDLAGVLAARDRTMLGLNAPSDGLVFVTAIYPGNGALEPEVMASV
ncbi:tRNA pseudouridine(38-40) synthase TruA [Sandarakinorhabdus sp.]|uniref:tRNA pseudouridine(38-40) synthase TruA n=1 Tax=Sandarakinorhabdus sp. TaxID=1916663 RepID=UPI00286DA246|nr:tRNA pseudouridine(38-40) synthase TruA [Sandarakinorhabdus sp.]